MAKRSQEEKSFLNVAGEFLVAAELNRRRIHAAVTYGSSKSADVWAFNHATKRAVRIEVKTTGLQNGEWVVGHKGNVGDRWDADVFWVLVHLPDAIPPGEAAVAARGAHSPRFYVLTSREMAAILAEKDAEYRTRFVARNQREPPLNKGVPKTHLDEVRSFAEGWQKITDRLEHATDGIEA